MIEMSFFNCVGREKRFFVCFHGYLFYCIIYIYYVERLKNIIKMPKATFLYQQCKACYQLSVNSSDKSVNRYETMIGSFFFQIPML